MALDIRIQKGLRGALAPILREGKAVSAKDRRRRQEISHFPVGKGQKNSEDETGIAREEEEGGPEERLQDCTAFILFAYILPMCSLRKLLFAYFVECLDINCERFE